MKKLRALKLSDLLKVTQPASDRAEIQLRQTLRLYAYTFPDTNSRSKDLYLEMVGNDTRKMGCGQIVKGFQARIRSVTLILLAMQRATDDFLRGEKRNTLYRH